MRALLYILLMTGLVAQRGEAEWLSSDVTSLNYYPHHGHLEILPEIMASTRDESFSSTHAATYTKSEQFLMNVNYGIAHRLRLGIAEMLTTGQSRSSVSAAGISTDSTAYGLANPTVTLAWRVFDSHADGLSGDLALSASPNFGDKDTDNGTFGHEGNQLSGSWNSGAAASVFWRWGLSEAEIREAFTQVLAGQTDGNGPATTSTTRPYSTVTSNLSERFHLGSDAFVQFGLTLNPTLVTHSHYDTQVTRSTTIPNYMGGRLNLGFRLKKNSVLELGANWHKDSTFTTSSAGADVSNQNQQVIVSIDFLHQI
jgi:hypothetical protein